MKTRHEALEEYFEKTGNILDVASVHLLMSWEQRYNLLWHAVCNAREIVHTVKDIKGEEIEY